MKKEKVKIYEKRGDEVKVYNGHMVAVVNAEHYEDVTAAEKDKKPSKCLDSK